MNAKARFSMVMIAGHLFAFLAAVLCVNSAGAAALESLAERNGKFAFDLYGEVQSRKPSENIFFSPFSISTAFAMAYAGAAGETATQMAHVLNFTNLPNVHEEFSRLLDSLNDRQHDNAYTLHVANSLWGQQDYDFRPAFLNILRQSYGSPLRTVDFATRTDEARAAINAWVAAKTNDTIRDIVPQNALSELTRLTLVNAIYFKSSWMSVFQKSATREQPFFLLSGEQVTAPLMQQIDRFPYAETDQVQILELPYQRGELGMLIVLPKTKGSLPAIEAGMQFDRLRAWLAELRIRRVHAAIPKFQVETDLPLKDLLMRMGITHAFQAGKADFSGMHGARELFVHAALHKAFIDVDEQGTEAAAATAITVGVTAAMPEEPVVFRADHPFLFFIRDRKTGSILFMGRLAHPDA